jgi:argininosuccinate lyase
LPPMLRTARWRVDRMAEAAVADFSLATDAADFLTRRGVPFREAHAAIGKLVASSLAAGKTFGDLSQAEWAATHPLFASERPPLDAAASIAARDVPGGTAPWRVADQLAETKRALVAARASVRERDEDRAAMMTPPQGAEG